MTTATCRNCRHWRHTSTVENRSFGMCLNAVTHQRIRPTGTNGVRRILTRLQVPQAEVLEVVDDIGIRTEAYFGCRFFEGKG